VSGSGISWAIWKSAPCTRQIPRQHPTTQFFAGQMPFLPPNQQRQSTEGIWSNSGKLEILFHLCFGGNDIVHYEEHERIIVPGFFDCSWNVATLWILHCSAKVQVFSKQATNKQFE